MEVLTLPPNFDKYNKIIEYFRNNGFDCLSTLQEQFRFFVSYIYVSAHRDFNSKLNSFTNLHFQHNPWWGRWHNPDNDGDDDISIKALIFDMPGYRHFDINKTFLHMVLSETKDKTILMYFRELHSYGQLVDISTPKYITIGNKFNNATTKVKKDDFYKFCGYAELIKDYKRQDFVIDIEFNDNVANYISDIINDGCSTVFVIDIEEFEQKIAVIDFLQISYQYKFNTNINTY